MSTPPVQTKFARLARAFALSTFAVLGILILIIATAPDPAPDVSSRPREREVARADLGNQWPLAVDAGTIGCRGAGATYFRYRGIEYGLNGMASERDGYAEIRPIWADDVEGTRKLRETLRLVDPDAEPKMQKRDISVLNRVALELCPS